MPLEKENKMEFVQAMQEMGNEIVRRYTEKKADTVQGLSELEKQVLFVYLFGMANGVIQEKFANISPVEVETGMIAVMMTVFGVTFLDAQAFVASILKDVQSRNPENTVYAIVHQGLEGYFAWEKEQKEEVITDIERILEILT